MRNSLFATPACSVYSQIHRLVSEGLPNTKMPGADESDPGFELPLVIGRKIVKTKEFFKLKLTNIQLW